MNGQPKYLQNLLILNLCKSPYPQNTSIIKMWSLADNKWSVELYSHPDRDFVNYVLQQIATGFQTGCNRTHAFVNQLSLMWMVHWFLVISRKNYIKRR